MRQDCIKQIKNQLTDPRSFKAIQVRYFPHKMNENPADVVDTFVSFRSKNSYGGYAEAFGRYGFDRNGVMVGYPNVVSGR